MPPQEPEREVSTKELAMNKLDMIMVILAFLALIAITITSFWTLAMAMG